MDRHRSETFKAGLVRPSNPRLPAMSSRSRAEGVPAIFMLQSPGHQPRENGSAPIGVELSVEGPVLPSYITYNKYVVRYST